MSLLFWFLFFAQTLTRNANKKQITETLRRGHAAAGGAVGFDSACAVVMFDINGTAIYLFVCLFVWILSMLCLSFRSIFWLRLHDLSTYLRTHIRTDDGSLDYNEFLAVMKKARAFALDQPRDTGVLRAAERVWRCIRQEV